MTILNLLLQSPTAVFEELAKAGLVFLLMGTAIWLLINAYKAEKAELKEVRAAKEAEIRELNAYIQQMAEKNITTLKDVQTTMDKVFDNQVAGNQELQREIMDNCIQVQNNLADMIKDLKQHLPKKHDEIAA